MPRAESGGHSTTRRFVAGQLSPQPSAVKTTHATPTTFAGNLGNSARRKETSPGCFVNDERSILISISPQSY